LKGGKESSLHILKKAEKKMGGAAIETEACRGRATEGDNRIKGGEKDAKRLKKGVEGHKVRKIYRDQRENQVRLNEIGCVRGVNEKKVFKKKIVS